MTDYSKLSDQEINILTMAYHESGMSYTDRKPLRAAMIVFLMMKESE